MVVVGVVVVLWVVVVVVVVMVVLGVVVVVVVVVVGGCWVGYFHKNSTDPPTGLLNRCSPPTKFLPGTATDPRLSSGPTSLSRTSILYTCHDDKE